MPRRSRNISYDDVPNAAPPLRSMQLVDRFHNGRRLAGDEVAGFDHEAVRIGTSGKVEVGSAKERSGRRDRAGCRLGLRRLPWRCITEA
jgi:hypothetical protein